MRGKGREGGIVWRDTLIRPETRDGGVWVHVGGKRSGKHSGERSAERGGVGVALHPLHSLVLPCTPPLCASLLCAPPLCNPQRPHSHTGETRVTRQRRYDGEYTQPHAHRDSTEYLPKIPHSDAMHSDATFRTTISAGILCPGDRHCCTFSALHTQLCRVTGAVKVAVDMFSTTRTHIHRTYISIIY